MNSDEMFTEISNATGRDLRAYMQRKQPLPVCNDKDLLISTFCRCMDANSLITELERVEKVFWAARKAAELRRDHEEENPTGVTPFCFLR